jgi:predicted ATPase
MITTIHISNFKSISGVEFSLNKFNCIVGMNGAGKSTLLQSIDFIAQLMRGGISNWLELRGWNYKDIQPNGKHVHLSLGIGYKLKNGSFLYWTGLFDRRSAKTIIEVAHINGFNETLFTSNRRTYTLDGKPFPINFEYQGSILSQLKDSLLPPEIREFRDALRNIRSLELLSPHLLRKRSRAQDKDIGAGGEKLSGFLASLKGEHKARLVEVLRTLYPYHSTQLITH